VKTVTQDRSCVPEKSKKRENGNERPLLRAQKEQKSGKWKRNQFTTTKKPTFQK
jgi:hypothetical protein